MLADIEAPQELWNLLEEDVFPADSTTIKVMERHPEWKNMLVVVDWTGSMYPYGAQLVLWQKYNLNKNCIRHLVFFNDGNSKKSHHKELGKTGGIYPTDALDLEQVILTMEKVMMKGNGGDSPENDLEAMLKSTHYLKDFDELVLIADNTSNVRDLALLHRLKTPVHIILCGTAESNYINSDYVKIAFHTGGSLHTIDEDLEEISELKAGEVIAIGNLNYEVKEGKIVQYVRNK